MSISRVSCQWHCVEVKGSILLARRLNAKGRFANLLELQLKARTSSNFYHVIVSVQSRDVARHLVWTCGSSSNTYSNGVQSDSMSCQYDLRKNKITNFFMIVAYKTVNVLFIFVYDTLDTTRVVALLPNICFVLYFSDRYINYIKEILRSSS